MSQSPPSATDNIDPSAMDLETFCHRNRIDLGEFKKANIEWVLLQEIASDHQSSAENLRETAELFARLIQKFPNVHSVRWRVKDWEHLIEKIVRKKLDNNPKYLDINATNYHALVTDLVGVRALHLFKDEFISIDKDLRRTWKLAETPIIYTREGDQPPVDQSTGEFEARKHPAGYRSIHYIVEAQPTSRKVLVEVQVRTIFEEGWSEIDHRIRYPNFLSDKMVEYFLTIFNRLSGNADEMGTFVKGLSAQLSDLDSRIRLADNEKQNTLAEMESLLVELESVKKQDKDSQDKLKRLREEVSKLRSAAPGPSAISLRSEFFANERHLATAEFGSGVASPFLLNVGGVTGNRTLADQILPVPATASVNTASLLHNAATTSALNPTLATSLARPAQFAAVNLSTQAVASIYPSEFTKNVHPYSDQLSIEKFTSLHANAAVLGKV